MNVWKPVICDVYIHDKTDGACLKQAWRIIREIDVEALDSPSSYQGYVGLNVTRLTGMMAVMRLRDVKIRASNVPIRYRDFPNITVNDATRIIENTTFAAGAKVTYSTWRGASCPLFWLFEVAYPHEESAGACRLVDRLDGHIWEGEEAGEYNHDYNNMF